MNCIDDILITSTVELKDQFECDELSYLALTSKVENPFRDKLAYILYKKLYSEYHVSREFKRFDISIHDENKLLAVIELKACYSFDLIKEKSRDKYFGKMKNDADKAKQKANELFSKELQIYTILLATHPNSCDVESPSIKYRDGIRKALSQFGNEVDLRSECFANVSLHLDSKLIDCGVINAGEAYSTETSILYWILKW